MIEQAFKYEIGRILYNSTSSYIDMKLIEIYFQIEKFWIDTKTGIFELLPDDGEHETDLPGDGNLDFQEAIDAGWVRGGHKSGRDSSVYLQGHTLETVSKALKRALVVYAPEKVTMEWDGGFASLEGNQIYQFAKNGRLPKKKKIDEVQV